MQQTLDPFSTKPVELPSRQVIPWDNERQFERDATNSSISSNETRPMPSRGSILFNNTASEAMGSFVQDAVSTAGNLTGELWNEGINLLKYMATGNELGEHQSSQTTSNETPTTLNQTATSTTELDPELNRQQDNNEILRVRHFFQEISHTPTSSASNIIRTSQGGVVSLEQVLEAVGFSNTAVSAKLVTDGNGNLRRDLEQDVESPQPTEAQMKKMDREAQLNQAIGRGNTDFDQNKIAEAGSVLSPVNAGG